MGLSVVRKAERDDDAVCRASGWTGDAMTEVKAAESKKRLASMMKELVKNW